MLESKLFFLIKLSLIDTYMVFVSQVRILIYSGYAVVY